jgi:hypothetical protein
VIPLVVNPGSAEEMPIQLLVRVEANRLAFDRRLAIAREIAAYQKHRIKRIRRDSATDSCATYH